VPLEGHEEREGRDRLINTPAAMINPQSMSAEWKRSWTPTGSVFSSSEEINMRVKM
jgi:hypothetical protein